MHYVVIFAICLLRKLYMNMLLLIPGVYRKMHCVGINYLLNLHKVKNWFLCNGAVMSLLLKMSISFNDVKQCLRCVEVDCRRQVIHYGRFYNLNCMVYWSTFFFLKCSCCYSYGATFQEISGRN